jgi:hypothetical protein
LPGEKNSELFQQAAGILQVAGVVEPKDKFDIIRA